MNKESPSDGGGVKGAALSTEKQDISLGGSVNQTVIQNSSYLISRNGIYYYSRRVPADLHKRFNKDRVIISLRTRSQDKALRSAQTLSDRLERYWEIAHLRRISLPSVGHTFQTIFKPACDPVAQVTEI